METKTKEQYLKDLGRRSFNTAKGHNTAINAFELFEKERKPDLTKPLGAISDFIEWLEVGGKSAVTINGYVIKTKKYLRLVRGIKLDNDEFKDFVTMPQVIDEELDPMTKAEFKLIIENCRTPRRRALCWFIASIGFRIAECMQIRKYMINFDVTPALVTAPAKIVKGKKFTRFQYLSKENTPLIRSICNKLDDNDLVFTHTEILVNTLSNEQHSLKTLLENIGLNEKYDHNGHLKKSFHAMRSFSSTQIYDITRDSEYAHAYIGHSAYLKQYLRKSPEKRTAMFLEVESALSLFSNTENSENSKINKIEKMLETALNEIEILKAEKNTLLN